METTEMVHQNRIIHRIAAVEAEAEPVVDRLSVAHPGDDPEAEVIVETSIEDQDLNRCK